MAGLIHIYCGDGKGNAKYVLTDKGHQDVLLREGYEPESVVLRDTRKQERKDQI